VLVDTPIALVVRADFAARTKVYASPEEALADFRLRPPGSSADPALLERVARASLRREGDGWTWNVDSATRQRFIREEIEARIPAIAAAVSFVYGSESALVDAAAGDDVARRLGRDVPTRAVEGAHHHVPLDRPRDCALAIDEVLALTG
jgi:pimeloyl-ACP methyl ester carboxylesterase